MKSLLFIMFSVLSLNAHSASSNYLTKEEFYSSSGLGEMCDDKEYMSCIKVSDAKCQEVVKKCFAALPDRISASSIELIGNKLNECMWSEAGLSESVIAKCDQLVPESDEMEMQSYDEFMRDR